MSKQTQGTTAADPTLASVTDLTSARQAREKKARKASNRTFDAAKVERLKAEIAAGSYQINYARVADKFIEHERNNP